jgi:hypothetical protein
VGSLTGAQTGFFVCFNLFAEITVGNLDIRLHSLNIICRHQMEKAIFNVTELVIIVSYVRAVHVQVTRAKVFELLAGERIDGDQVDFGVIVLLGRFRFDDLAGSSVENDMTKANRLTNSSRLYECKTAHLAKERKL